MATEPSFSLEKRFADTLRENDLVRTGDTVLVGLSGGADSTALLHLFQRIAPAWNLTVRAAHLDHGIRPESRGDVRFVRKICRECNIPLDVTRRDVPARAAGQGLGLEAVARTERQEYLLRTAEKHGCRVIALGHHRMDQAETVLHRLLRGSGISGLAAMQHRRGPWIRPLLFFPREQIREYLARRKIPYLEDPSNTDPIFTRNRIRHQLLPFMKGFNPRIVDGLVRLSRQAADEEDFWREETDRLLKRVVRATAEDLTLDREKLRGLHPAARRRLLRRILGTVRGSLDRISHRHLLDLESFILSDQAQGELHLPRIWVGRRYQDILVKKEAPEMPEPFEFIVEGPGPYRLPDGKVLKVSLVPGMEGEDQDRVEFDADSVGFPLTVRTALPGDRFRPSGRGGSKKLKDFFIDQKIDSRTRRMTPLVFENDLLWVVGLRRCQGLEPHPEGPVLQLRILPPQNRPNRRTN